MLGGPPTGLVSPLKHKGGVGKKREGGIGNQKHAFGVLQRLKSQDMGGREGGVPL